MKPFEVSEPDPGPVLAYYQVWVWRTDAWEFPTRLHIADIQRRLILIYTLDWYTLSAMLKT